MTTPREALLACQCGATAELTAWGGGDWVGEGYHRARCLRSLCCASTTWYPTEAEAIAAWNRRTATAPQGDAGEGYECVVCGEPWPDGVKSCPRVSTCDGYRWLNPNARQKERIAALESTVSAQAALAEKRREEIEGLRKALEKIDRYARRSAEKSVNRVTEFRSIANTAQQAIAATPAEGVWVPTHRHYKGGLYQVLFEARDSEQHEEMTIYRSADGRYWARPTWMFNELVDGVPRFAPIAAQP